MPLASLTSSTTHLLEHHGVIAVFLLLAVDAILPVGGELPMLLSGAVAAGAIGHGTSLFGTHVATGLASYLTLAAAGTAGSLAGALAGWLVGLRGGRDLIARRGHWLHLPPARLARAERWFERRGRWAILLGRLTPLVRSFISVTAGVLRAPLLPYLLLSAVASALWCFGLAGAGWALGSRWEDVHHLFRYLDALAVVGVAAAAVLLLARWRRRGAAVARG